MSGFFRQNRPSILRQNSPAATVGLAHFGVSLCVGAVHLVFVPQLLVELPHLIRFQVEDTEDRLHPVLDGYALLLGGGKNHAAACQRFFQKF